MRRRLQDIYENSGSDFVKENVAAFVNMTPETFSGVYANTVKETHWLSYPNYAALVSGGKFSTSDIAAGNSDVFINLDLKTLETHSGLARVIIGALLNAIYNLDGRIQGRALFLLDEVARLGCMRFLETARDAGRKYGITLTMIYQSLGQMRETYGGRDATSKWFESASWVSFAAINDPETADYISKRCGTTTVEIDQVSRSSQAKGSSRTRSKQLAARALIQPHEVLQRTDHRPDPVPRQPRPRRAWCGPGRRDRHPPSARSRRQDPGRLNLRVRRPPHRYVCAAVRRYVRHRRGRVR